MAVIPEGTHLVRVHSTFLGKSKNTQTGYVGVVFEDDAGDTITAYLYTSDKAIGRTVETLELLGWDLQANNGDLSTLHETPLLHGRQSEIVVENETYEGKTRAKVKWINGPDGGGRAEGMPANEAQAFAAALRAKVYGSKAGKPPAAKVAPKPAARAAVKAVPVQTAEAEQQGDDDIPF